MSVDSHYHSIVSIMAQCIKHASAILSSLRVTHRMAANINIGQVTWGLILGNILFASCSSYEKYQQNALHIHNAFRARHHSPPLVLDNQLNKMAARCAAYYLEQKRSDHKCPHKMNTGENLASGKGNYIAASFTEAVVNAWYDEISLYNYTNPGFETKTGHFTQIVWKSSAKLGVAYAEKDQSHALVCLYSPTGNVKSQFHENVLKPNATKSKKIHHDITTIAPIGKASHVPLQNTFVDLVKHGLAQKVGCSSRISPNSSQISSYQERALKLHNEARRKHNSSDLSLNAVLNEVAVRCAEYFATHRNIDVKCPYLGKSGQNIGAGPGQYTAKKFLDILVNKWYATGEDYDYTKLELTPSTGHFTQMIWKASKKLGVGYAQANGFHAAVALYCPPGNIKGKVAHNVERPVPIKP